MEDSQNDAPGTFLDRYRDFGELIRELMHVHRRNVSFTEWNPDYLFFSEGVLVIVAIERFLRIILGGNAGERDTMRVLLKKAVSEKRLVSLPDWEAEEKLIHRITRVRNYLLHGNYEQAAAVWGHASHLDYFKSSNYINEVNTLVQLLEHMLQQVDPRTGKPQRGDQ